MNAVPIAMPDMRTAAVAMVVRFRQDANQASAMAAASSSMVTVLSGAFDWMGQAVTSGAANRLGAAGAWLRESPISSW